MSQTAILLLHPPRKVCEQRVENLRESIERKIFPGYFEVLQGRRLAIPASDRFPLFTDVSKRFRIAENLIQGSMKAVSRTKTKKLLDMCVLLA